MKVKKFFMKKTPEKEPNDKKCNLKLLVKYSKYSNC